MVRWPWIDGNQIKVNQLLETIDNWLLNLESQQNNSFIFLLGDVLLTKVLQRSTQNIVIQKNIARLVK
mgnify:FL=1